MNKHLTAVLAAGAVAAGLAVAAPAEAALPLPSGAAYVVPAGKIEHRIEIRQVSGAKAIPSRTRTESWVTADRSRTVVSDLRTGRVTAETVATPTSIRAYNAARDVVLVEHRDKPGGLPENSSAFEAAVQKAYIDQGIVQVTGETVVGGRRALITESVERNWRTDAPGTKTTAVVDAETYALYRRTTVNDAAGIRQTETYTTELLDATPANVKATTAMTRRPHVKIRHRH